MCWDDAAYLAECGWNIGTAALAELIVARGSYTINHGHTVIDKREDAAAYEAALNLLLEQCAARQIPMLVTNPDKYSPQEGHPAMPGQIGDAYAKILRRLYPNDNTKVQSLIKRVGKPFDDVYDIVLAYINDGDKNDTQHPKRVCMVGDTLETDIVGGMAAGMGTIWVVMDGIHRTAIRSEETLLADAQKVVDDLNQSLADTVASVDSYASGQTVRPEHVLAHFRW